MVSNDTIMIRGKYFINETRSRIESETEVKAYLQDLKYALEHGAKIEFQIKRTV